MARSCSASAARATTSHAGLDEEVGQAVAEQPRVVGDHDPHGSTASTVVPLGVAGDAEPSSRRLDPVAQPAQPWSVGVGAPVAVVVDPQPQVAVVPVHVDLDPVGRGMLLRVHHGLADHRPRRELDPGVEAVTLDLDAQRHGGVAGHVVERGGQPPSASAAGCRPFDRSRSSRTAAWAASAPSVSACASARDRRSAGRT
jgi:hypothetical protein